MSADRKLMAVDVQTESPVFKAGIPHPLFEVRLVQAFHMPEPVATFNLSYPYVVADNGQRFLIAVEPTRPDGTPAAPITVLLNWPSLLKK